MARVPAGVAHSFINSGTGDLVEADSRRSRRYAVKFLERIPGTHKRLYQFTAIDDCTRLRVLKVYDACNQRTAIQFIDEVVRRLPFRVHVTQTDNGAEFQSQFHWHVEGLDIRHA